MESVYHIVTIHVNETSWAHVWRLHFCYLGTGYDKDEARFMAVCRVLEEICCVRWIEHINHDHIHKIYMPEHSKQCLWK
jgi:hypothetical protein